MAEASSKPSPLTENADFAAAVAEAKRQLREELGQGLASASSQGAETNMMQQLAMHIAELTDQGKPTKRIAPEVLAERAAAHERAIALIIQAKKNGERPTYRLSGKVVFNERLIEPFTRGTAGKALRTEIMWTGMPNHVMIPLNEAAKEIHREFLASVGTPEIIPTEDKRQLWMTDHGLVVRGDPPKRMIGGNIVADALSPFDEAVEVGNEKTGPQMFDPSTEEVRVLGTIAPAARQNLQPNAPVYARQ